MVRAAALILSLLSAPIGPETVDLGDHAVARLRVGLAVACWIVLRARHDWDVYEVPVEGLRVIGSAVIVRPA